MIPADLGRFFRPYGAELMHAHPPPEPSQTQTHTHTHTHTQRERERDTPSFLKAAVSSIKKKKTGSDAAGSRLRLTRTSESPRRSVPLFPEQERVAGRTDPQQLPLHPSREESHLQPLLKAEREAPPSSAARSRVRRIQREPTAKQVVTHRLTINCLGATEAQKKTQAGCLLRASSRAER